MSKVLQVELEAEKEIVKHNYMVPFYSQIFFQKDIFNAIGWIPPAKEMNVICEVYRIARAQNTYRIIQCCARLLVYSGIPRLHGSIRNPINGFLLHDGFHVCSRFTLSSLDKERTQNWVSCDLLPYLFLCKFWSKCYTFVVLGRLRSTCHGISAAAGKAGAVVGAFGFLYAAQSKDTRKIDTGYSTAIQIKNSLIMLGVVNFIGMLFILLVPESKGKSLKELSGENEEADAEAIEMAGSARTIPV